MTPKRAVIYARVSTDDQADKGYSLPSQLELCRKYVQQLGYTVVVELTEDYTGGIPIAERPTGKQLAAMVKTRQIDAVIVYQVDRLSRDIVNLLATVQMWLRAGIEIHTCDIGKIESELDIVLVIKGWQGSDERKKIIERTMRGRNGKAQSGKVVGGGRPPYGYRFIKDTNGIVMGLEIYEEEGRIVRLIYRWYVYGDEAGAPLSIYEITRKLSEMRIITAGETRRNKRKRPSGMWASSQVITMLTNETYAGVWHFRKRIGNRNRKEDLRPLEEQIAVSVPAIIERDLWEQAQARRERNKRMARRNAKYDYLLRCIIRCGCGRAMTGRFMGRYRYYHCCWRSSHIVNVEDNPCKEKYVRADWVESLAFDYVKNLFVDPVNFERRLRIAQQKELAEFSPKRDELEAITANILQTERQAEELGRALTRADPDGIVAKSLKKQEEEINARHKEQIQRRDKLTEELGARRLTDERIARALSLRERVARGMENPTAEDKRQVFEMLGLTVTVTNGEAKFDCLVPEEALAIEPTSSPIPD